MLLFQQFKKINNNNSCNNLLKNLYYKNVNMSTHIIYENALSYKKYRYIQLYDKYIIDKKEKISNENLHKLFDKDLINKKIDYNNKIIKS